MANNKSNDIRHGENKMRVLPINTTSREQIIDITGLIAGAMPDYDWINGAVHIYCPHTTCGLTINESADPDVKLDLMRFFQEIAPREHDWRHREGNSDAHIRASLLGASLLIPLEAGQLCLGTWQSIYFYEGDGPRRRKILLQLLACA